MKTVDQLMAEELAKPWARQSSEYKAGLRAGLELRIEGKEIDFPYRAGTARADAFYFGALDGDDIGRKNRDADKEV